MPQMILPLFSKGATAINEVMSWEKKDGSVYYFHAGLPVFTHAEGDVRSFRLITSQLYLTGNCSESEIVKAFGVSAISVKRWVKRYREEGAGGFYRTAGAHQPRVLTEEVMKAAQERLSEGESRKEVAAALGIKPDTLYRAIRAGRLVEGKKKPSSRR
jgi:transposase